MSASTFFTMAFSQWLRNFWEFRRTWVTAMFWSTLEPLFYLLAFGFGVGRLVGMVGELAYVEFIVSGVILVSALIVSYSEASWLAFRKLANEGARNYLLTTPTGHNEFMVGELAWSIFRGLLTAIVLVLFALSMSVVPGGEALRILALSFLMAWIGSALGIGVGIRVRAYNQVLLLQAVVLFPLIVLSGTFFPLDLLPSAIRPMSFLTPITHGNFLVRGMGSAAYEVSPMVSILVLLGLAWTSFSWARDGVERHFTQNRFHRQHLRQTVQ